MPEPFKVILDKMKSVIDTAEKDHEIQVNRFLCLANRRLHKLINETPGITWAVIGGSLAIKQQYECKFGIFIPSLNT